MLAIMKNNLSIESIKQLKLRKSILVSVAISELSKRISSIEEEIDKLNLYLNELKDSQSSYKRDFYQGLSQYEKFNSDVFLKFNLELEKYSWKIDQKIDGINNAEEQLLKLQSEQQILKNQYIELMRKLEKYAYIQNNLIEVDEC